MTVAEEDTTAVLPLLCVQDRVLFPGETLPMYINNPHVSGEGRVHIVKRNAHGLHLLRVLVFLCS